MKEIKRIVLTMLCVGVVLGTVACGTGNSTREDGVNDTNTEMEKTRNNNDENVVDDLGNTIGNGVEDIGQGVKDITDDITGDNKNALNDKNHNDMTNDATNGTVNGR